jgi:hypothetical protein
MLIIREASNAIATTVLLVVIGGLPLASPETLSRLVCVPRYLKISLANFHPQSTVAPDDTVTLWEWASFTWVNRFITFGGQKELNEEDLPPLSLTMQTGVTFERFQRVKTRALLTQLMLAHRLDLALDLSFTVLSVILEYAGPFFLKKIL